MTEVKHNQDNIISVFASQDIKIGSIITYYEGKIIDSVDIAKVNYYTDDELYFAITHDRVVPHYEKDNIIKHLQLNAVEQESTRSNYGLTYKEILETKSTNYGSIIIDNVWKGNMDKYIVDMLEDNQDINKVNSHKDFIKYCFDNNGFLINTKKYNCCLKRDCVPKGICSKLFTDKVSQYAIIAKRDIAKGEELSINYGTDYWYDKEQTDTNFPNFIDYIEEKYKKDQFAEVREFVLRKASLFEKQ